MSQLEPVVAGEASGAVLATREPLSFWGGYDAETGRIIDRRHPLNGQLAKGHVLVMPFTRGSSTTAAILLESIRRETAPAAIVTDQVDSFLALASVVADEMFGTPLPILVADPEQLSRLSKAKWAAIHADGAFELS